MVAMNLRLADYGTAAKPTVTLTPETDRETYLNRIADGLAEVGQVFAMGGRVLTDHGGAMQLIASGRHMAQLAGRLLSITREDHSGNTKTIVPTSAEGDLMLWTPALRSRLPQLRFFSEAPVLDENFHPMKPGYNESARIYYHGQAIAPSPSLVHLNRVRSFFCLKRPVDWANLLGFMLTPLLGDRFRGGRPMCVIRGNQPGIGKSEAAKAIALMHSPSERLMSVTYKADDKEFEKEIAAAVQLANCVLIDNVRAPRISSPALERTITMPTFNFRRIGTSQTITGENYLQFVVTCNGGELSQDLATRSLFILMEYDRDPANREPLEIAPSDYVRLHRNEILAELLGMVSRWRERGHYNVPVPGRFMQWTAMINGILEANGISGFASTYGLDAREGNELQIALEELAAAIPGQFMRPKDILHHFARLRLFRDRLKGRNQRAQQTVVGTILKATVGREVRPEGDSGPVFIVEKREDSNGTLYGFIAKGEDGSSGSAAPKEPAEPQG